MKLISSILFLFSFLNVHTQENARTFYLHFWHAQLYNPSAPANNSMAILNSAISLNKKNQYGYWNLAGNISLPIQKNKHVVGINISSANEGILLSKDLSFYFQDKLKIKDGIYFIGGISVGMQSSLNILDQPYFVNPSLTIPKGSYNKNTFQFNSGFSILIKKISLGFSCRNCTQSEDIRDYQSLYKSKKEYFLQGSYSFSMSRKLDIRIDAIARDLNYDMTFDGSISTFYKNKYYAGFSTRNNFPVDAAFLFGYKWNNYWFIGVIQPGNRYDTQAFEMAVQLEIPYKN